MLRRIHLTYFAFFALVVGAVTGFAFWNMERWTLERAKDDLKFDAHLASEFLSNELDEQFSAESLKVSLGELELKFLGRHLVVFGDDGRVWAASSGVSSDSNFISFFRDHPRRLRASPNASVEGRDKNRFVYGLSPLGTGILMVVNPWERLQDLIFLRRMLVLFAGPGSLGLIFWILSGRVAAYERRIEGLLQVAERGLKGDFARVASEEPNDDIGRIGRSINRYAELVQIGRAQTSEEERKLRAILNHMEEGVIALDSERRILLMNPASLGMFGLKGDRVRSRLLIEVLPDEKLDLLAARALEEVKAFSQEMTLNHVSDKILFVNAVGLGRGDVGVILVIHDVTELRKLEHMRKDFVANVSHELRTPLTSIQGFIETLMGGAVRDTGKALEFLKMMDEDTRRLSRLVGDLLELAQIDSKHLPTQLEAVDLKRQVESCYASFASRASEKKLRLTLDSSVSLPEVKADPHRIAQVLLNLLDNAIKFSPEGGLIVTKLSPHDREVICEITDEGPGIPDESLPKIFERFYRVDRARSRELGGTGLGLAIVKGIIADHGGRVGVRSRLNHGSTFFFALPRA